MDPKQKKIVRITVSDMCMESYPCQHGCELIYDDGTSQRSGLSGWSAVTDQYWPYLSQQDKQHFTYMKTEILKQTNKSDYQKFLLELGLDGC